MATLSNIFVKVCILSFGFFHKPESLGALMVSLEFALRIVDNVLCYCLCLFDAIVDICALDETCSMTFSLESEWSLHVTKAYLT